MNKNTLLQIFKNQLSTFNFIYNELGMTWQVSYVWIAMASKENYQSIEHFYYASINSSNNTTSNYVGQAEWEERVSISDWINSKKGPWAKIATFRLEFRIYYSVYTAHCSSLHKCILPVLFSDSWRPDACLCLAETNIVCFKQT